MYFSCKHSIGYNVYIDENCTLPIRNARPQPSLESYTENGKRKTHDTKERKMYTGCLTWKTQTKGKKPRQPAGCKLSLC